MKVKVTLVKSFIGSKDNQIQTAKSLGLSRIGDFVEVKLNNQLRGMINTIAHLVKIEKI